MAPRSSLTAASLFRSVVTRAAAYSHTELIEEVSRNLRPAPRIREAADAIVGELTANGSVYNGVHLRVEADANFKTYADTAEVRASESGYGWASG